MASKRSTLLLREALVLLTLVVVLAVVIRTLVWTPFFVADNVFAPTVQRGDFILVTKWGYGWGLPYLSEKKLWPQLPEKEALVVLRCPHLGGAPCLRRVVGLPGDLVHLPMTGSGSLSGSSPVRVPPGHFYVQSDDEGSLPDSRSFGAVSVHALVGPARWIWYSVGGAAPQRSQSSSPSDQTSDSLEATELRWERFFKAIN